MRTIATALLGLAILAATSSGAGAADFRLQFGSGHHHGVHAPRHLGFKKGFVGRHVGKRSRFAHPGGGFRGHAFGHRHFEHRHHAPVFKHHHARPRPGQWAGFRGAPRWHGAHVPLERVIRHLDRRHGFHVTDARSTRGNYVLKGFGPHGKRAKVVIDRRTGAIERVKRYHR